MMKMKQRHVEACRFVLRFRTKVEGIVARAAVGAELLTATFAIAAGQARDIMLGN